MKEIREILLDFEILAHAIRVSEMSKATYRASMQEALGKVEREVTEYILGIIGEDYVFDRPKDDYLPNVYIHLKAKNELRAEQRAKLTSGEVIKDES